MQPLVDLLRRAEAAGVRLDGGRIMAPRGIDPVLLAEVRADRERVAEGLRVLAAADALSDECGADAVVRRWTRLMALATLLDGAEAEAVCAEADAIVGLPDWAYTPLIGEALRLGATVVAEEHSDAG